ncbi:hypothetical protein SBI_09197 [Streptomyces bingchenggensis BCW-1]|uniref:Uncharacterized protein n=1 Tax=Streptomyces bingchenggensis (strain BCW-1) TaxID=749414 RepID=D7C3U9_STRBB|nr:hypothetical protein SBI_09197 [Streptomyces bingchenggensis BCW-1]
MDAGPGQVGGRSGSYFEGFDHPPRTCSPRGPYEAASVNPILRPGHVAQHPVAPGPITLATDWFDYRSTAADTH